MVPHNDIKTYYIANICILTIILVECNIANIYLKKRIKYMYIKDIFLDTIDSTQLWAKNNYNSFDPQNITCITAEQQTKGYGRYNRTWLSPKDMCIASTFYFSLPISTNNLSSLAQLICISLAKVLQTLSLAPQIKWPNDVMLNEKKLSGVLCQTIFEKDIVHIFLGIGININMDEKTAKQIDQPATSLLIQTDKNWDKNKFLKLLQKQFLEDLSLFLKKGFTPLLPLYNELVLYKNKEITLFDGKNNYVGILDSINPAGELKLKLQNGNIKIFQTGDIFKTTN